MIPISINRYSRTIPVCILCHNFLHIRFSNTQLAKSYNTVNDILASQQYHEFRIDPLDTLQNIKQENNRRKLAKSNEKFSRLAKELQAQDRSIRSVMGIRDRLSNKEEKHVRKLEADGWIVRWREKRPKYNRSVITFQS